MKGASCSGLRTCGTAGGLCSPVKAVNIPSLLNSSVPMARPPSLLVRSVIAKSFPGTMSNRLCWPAQSPPCSTMSTPSAVGRSIHVTPKPFNSISSVAAGPTGLLIAAREAGDRTGLPSSPWIRPR